MHRSSTARVCVVVQRVHVRSDLVACEAQHAAERGCVCTSLHHGSIHLHAEHARGGVVWLLHASPHPAPESARPLSGCKSRRARRALLAPSRTAIIKVADSDYGRGRGRSPLHS